MKLFQAFNFIRDHGLIAEQTDTDQNSCPERTNFTIDGYIKINGERDLRKVRHF